MPSSVMFLMALGTHSVFEGMAVGLQTKADKVLEFAVAILVHEWVMAFTFGLEVDYSLLESPSFYLYPQSPTSLNAYFLVTKRTLRMKKQ